MAKKKPKQKFYSLPKRTPKVLGESIVKMLVAAFTKPVVKTVTKKKLAKCTTSDHVADDIIQNAVRIISTGEILKSSHVHDCVIGRFGKRKNDVFMIDGGTEYFRRSMSPRAIAAVESLCLTEDMSTANIVHKLLWGTMGKDGGPEVKHVFLRDCDTDHLKKIAAIPNVNKHHADVCKIVIQMRKKVPDWGIGYDLEKIRKDLEHAVNRRKNSRKKVR